ncbi:ATP-dependent helicase [Clostridium sporogenes]|uniref:ATP-dependent helicase n=1 Tax=Clostridium sporogenes TaxID=1509 RepID=UPI0013D476FD|nr:ATP-dependent helicase [Clostridium sporogenes]NFH40822.1 ATP-dependent helicase [Clostridium sporogenes]
MKSIKLYQLKNMKQCPFKAYVSQFNFKTLINKSSMVRKVYKNILCNYNFIKLSQSQLKDIISEQLEDKYFLTNQEKEIEVLTISNYLTRYIEYEKILNRKLLARNIYNDIQIGDKNIELNADIVFDNGDNIEIVKYKTSATKLSYKARTEKNLPKNDIELYLLKKLGEKLFSQYKKPIISSYYHLKGKNEDKNTYEQFLKDKLVLISKLNDLEFMAKICVDKKDKKAIDKQIKTIKDVLYFDNTKGNNIISFDYDNDLSDEIIKLSNTELNFDSEKCQSSDCEFCSYSTLCNHKYIDKNDGVEEVQSLKKSNGEVKLTEAQKQVVDIEEGNYRVNSVAGSGKSTTMVLRAIELFKRGYKPNDILMITFTNKGCEELKEKITYWLSYYDIKGIYTRDLNIFTFNSFGDSIISKEWNKLGFTEQPKLATMIDINDIIKELLIEYDKIDWLNYKNPLLNYPNAKGAFKQLLIYFNLIKSFNYNAVSLIENVLIKEKDNLSITELKEKSFLIFDLYDKFNEKLQEKNLLQYQDQALYLIELLEEYPELKNIYGYKHIIVDEYQDTDATQVDLLHLLSKCDKFKSLMVVGDNSQAIYSFRNTTPKNILNFDKEFDNVQDIFLLNNFRSTPQICNVANKLDKLNTQRIDKEIISKKENGKIPELLKFKTIDDENKYIAKLIQEKIKEGIPKHEICYIARTKKELLELQKLLNENDISNIVEASELYLDNTNVQCIINLANFFRNMEQDYYLMEYLLIADNKYLEMDNKSFEEIVQTIKNEIIEEIQEIDNQEDNESIEVINKEDLKINCFYKRIQPITEKDEVAKSFIENMQNRKFYTFNELLSYLYKISLYHDDTSIEKDDKKYDAIVLTTAHSSKGKEWSVVINSINKYKYEDIRNDLDLLEEERRLLFVSLTRAKDELYVTYNTNQNKIRNKGKYCLFADELQNVLKIEE